ncbi:MAG: hypothetical protein KZQ58_10365 [gamma proteobacterium symbiont of Bathyaustriella thionipta]|nr:hypothetical protein [gamma proteobacterium symbiont of Bathyaustriella thionipta]
MNQSICILCLTIFLSAPPFLFFFRFVKDKPSWWIIYLLIIVIGWLSALGTVIFYYQHLGDVIFRTENPPQALIDQWVNDGAKKVFVFLFGWLYSLIYSLPWLLLFYIAVMVRKWRQKPASS